MVERKDKKWRFEVKRYVHDHMNAAYVGFTVISRWVQISEMLRCACFYEEALLMGKLAVRHSKKLLSDFTEIRINALLVYGLAQMESMMPEKRLTH